MTAPSSLKPLKLYPPLALAPLTCALLVSCGGKQSFTSDDISSDDSDTATTREPTGTDGSDPQNTTASTHTAADGVTNGGTAALESSVDGSDVTTSETANGTYSFDAGAVDGDAGQQTAEHGTSDTPLDNTTDDPEGTAVTTCGRPAEDYAALGEDCHLVDLNCDGGVFTDDCGCGCLTAMTDPIAGACRAPAGTPLEVQANAVHKLNCDYSFDGIPGVVLRTELAYDEFVEQVLPRCGGGFDAPRVDFDSTMLFVAMVAERPNAEFLHAVVTEQDGIMVGFEGPAYCGGAAPPSSLFLLELPRSGHDVTYDVCYTGDCGDGPFPP